MILVLVFVLGLTACASLSPQMEVLGVTAPRLRSNTPVVVKIFVEVMNPSSQELSLERIEYRLVATHQFDTRGELQVRRIVGPGATAVLEIPVSLTAEQDANDVIPYVLEARLFASVDKGERSWQLRASGALAAVNTVAPDDVAKHLLSAGQFSQKPW